MPCESGRPARPRASRPLRAPLGVLAALLALGGSLTLNPAPAAGAGASCGEAGMVSVKGAIGPLAIGRSTASDVVRAFGRPRAVGRPFVSRSTGMTRELRYGDGRPRGHGRCSTRFRVAAALGQRLVAFETSWSGFRTPAGTRVGTPTAEAERRERRRARTGGGAPGALSWRRCAIVADSPNGFTYGGRPGATFMVLTLGTPRRPGSRCGGRVSSISIAWCGIHGGSPGQGHRRRLDCPHERAQPANPLLRAPLAQPLEPPPSAAAGNDAASSQGAAAAPAGTPAPPPAAAETSSAPSGSPPAGSDPAGPATESPQPQAEPAAGSPAPEPAPPPPAEQPPPPEEDAGGSSPEGTVPPESGTTPSGEAPPPAADDPSAEARQELIRLLEDVPSADGFRYGAVDSRGEGLDTLKVLERPGGGYLGVYHSAVNGTFQLKVATSVDLLNWTHRAHLDSDASQGTIAELPDGSYLVAYEKAFPSGISLRFRRYRGIEALLSGSHDEEYTAPRTLAPTAEGTPNIYSARLDPDLAHSEIEVGFHYYENGDVDRQARGTLTNFGEWKTSDEPALNEAFTRIGIRGNIGDRDHLVFRDHRFNVHEAQLVKHDWSSWRVYLYDFQAGSIDPLEPRTHGGSRAFGNATVSEVTAPSGRRALLVTQFLFYEGAAGGESGPLIYYREL